MHFHFEYLISLITEGSEIQIVTGIQWLLFRNRENGHYNKKRKLSWRFKVSKTSYDAQLCRWPRRTKSSDNRLLATTTSDDEDENEKQKKSILRVGATCAYARRPPNKTPRVFEYWGNCLTGIRWPTKADLRRMADGRAPNKYGKDTSYQSHVRNSCLLNSTFSGLPSAVWPTFSNNLESIQQFLLHHQLEMNSAPS